MFYKFVAFVRKLIIIVTIITVASLLTVIVVNSLSEPTIVLGIGVLLALLIVFAVVAGIFYYELIKLATKVAEEKKHPITTVPENGLVIVVKGEDAVACLHNIDGKTVVYQPTGLLSTNRDNWKVVDKNSIPSGHIEFSMKRKKVRGFFFVGIFSDTRVYRFKIDKARWKENPANSTAPLKELIEHQDEEVWYLRSNPERRMVLTDLEIGDGTGNGVHIGLELILELIDPLVAVFERKGQFYNALDAVAEEVMAHIVLNMTTDQFMNVPQTKQAGASPKQLFDLDGPNGIKEKINSNPGIKQVGYRVLKVIYRGFQPNSAFDKYIEALNAKAQATHQKEALIELAEAEAERMRKLGQGNADALAPFMEAAKKAFGDNIDPDVVIQVWQTVTSVQQATSKDSKLTTFIPQGAVTGSLFGKGKKPK